jgi:hypothetical protein
VVRLDQSFSTIDVMLIQYLNTDLELIAGEDLSTLAAHFEANGFFSLRCDRHTDGQWYGNFETDQSYEEPETNIQAMLTVIESLDGSARCVWQGCSMRQFNIGYDCGSDPWAFNNGLATETLRRIAASGASLRITIYPERPAPDAPTS